MQYYSSVFNCDGTMLLVYKKNSEPITLDQLSKKYKVRERDDTWLHVEMIKKYNISENFAAILISLKYSIKRMSYHRLRAS